MKKFIFIIVLGCLAWGKSKAYESGERNRYRVYFPTASIILNPAFKENKATLDSLVIHIQNKQKTQNCAASASPRVLRPKGGPVTTNGYRKIEVKVCRPICKKNSLCRILLLQSNPEDRIGKN